MTILFTLAFQRSFKSGRLSRHSSETGLSPIQLRHE